MTRVIANMSMSLDGFIADEVDGVGELFGWFFERLSVAAVRLGDPVITPGAGVTHLAYEVRR
jgi:hypothetical protein